MSNKRDVIFPDHLHRLVIVMIIQTIMKRRKKKDRENENHKNNNKKNNIFYKETIAEDEKKFQDRLSMWWCVSYDLFFSGEVREFREYKCGNVVKSSMINNCTCTHVVVVKMNRIIFSCHFFWS